MKKNKSVSGGILLEVIFMLAIMVAIFPFIQRDAKRRSDTLRNQMIVRDLIKLKTAVENYLKRQPTFEKNLIDISFDDLYESGLDKAFQKKNVLGQEYKVRVKLSQDDNKRTVYDAIVIATGEKNIPTMRIKDIVKESKGYAGYVEDGLVYGADWQLAVAPWNEDRNDIDKTSIVVKTGLSRKEYKFVSKKAGIGSSTMETDLHMNMQSIYNARNLFIGGFLELGSFNLKGSDGAIKSEFNDIAIGGSEADETGEAADVAKLSLSNGDMTVLGQLIFPLGLQMSNLLFSDDTLKTVMLQRYLTVNGNLDFNGVSNCLLEDPAPEATYEYASTDCNKLRFSKTINLKIPAVSGETIMFVTNLLSFDTSMVSNILKINNLSVRSFDSDKNFSNSSMPALKFNKVTVQGSGAYKLEGSTIGLNDIVVRDVNAALIATSGSATGVKKIGGIDITEKTPLSIVLRALYYEYGDVYKLVTADYPQGALRFLPWHLELNRRCEYASNAESTCSGWY